MKCVEKNYIYYLLGIVNSITGFDNLTQGALPELIFSSYDSVNNTYNFQASIVNFNCVKV